MGRGGGAGVVLDSAALLLAPAQSPTSPGPEDSHSALTPEHPRRPPRSCRREAHRTSWPQRTLSSWAQVLASAGTMPVTLALLLLLSQASADPCYHPGGRPRFCLPPVTQLAAMAASCPRACILAPGVDLGPRATCNGSMTLGLGGPFLLTSVSLRFCTPGPPALVLSAAWTSGGPWRSLWRRPAWPGALGGPERVTFRAPPGLRTSVVASHLRVELGGRAGLAAAGVRGRCQCHGHAARCAARAQPPRCRCRHHTTGPGCESCRPSHRDWPWRPATPQHPHPCLPCSCNQHARRCRFNSELFRLSGGQSGGVCERCRHHTAGRHCHYCQPGFWRDPSQPITSRKACRGIPEATTMLATTPRAYSAVLHAQVLASEAAGPVWQRLAVRVLAAYKQRARPVRRGSQDAWVPRADLACGCLRLQPVTHYLLLGSAAGGPDPTRLVLDRHGLALPWRPHWARPLRRLQQEERAGGCRGLGPPTPTPSPEPPGGLERQGKH
ncbi:netrin-5 isoform X9 [Sus scrofa]|uniref:netrin-5 isoform X9 n=1 Tax=Sus scrofa TaxID=9823 RepID=UPI000A2B79DD|nr:netrin-5 isoform X9 [Sus scrofa]